MDYDILSSQNPWWRGRERIEEDVDYRKWKEKEIRWIPGAIELIDLRAFSLNFIFGPRQVGKTTILKLLTKKLLDEGVRVESIFYFRCDEVSDFRELDELINSYLAIKKRLKIEKAYIFLDEITFPREWYRAIKFLIDSGKFRDDVLVLTGSLSLFVRKEIETFPGRRGHGKDILLLPLSFREFIGVVKPELWRKLPKIDHLTEDEIVEKSARCLPLLSELNELLDSYMICGGFPLTIQSFMKTSSVERDAMDTYLAWLKNDITRCGRDIDIARSILKVTLTKMPSPVSWEGISKETEVKSHKTVNSYIHLLKSLFVLLILYHIDPNNGNINFGKNKKIHFIDPFFYHLFQEWCLVRINNLKNVIAESLAASHLARFASGDFGDNISYWKNRSEIDVVVDTRMGFEVKWGKSITKKRIFVGKIKQYITLSKDTFDDDLAITPMSAFLACL